MISPGGEVWHGGRRYDIGAEPSPYFAGPGAQFIKNHLSSVPTPFVVDLGAWRGRNVPILEQLVEARGGQVVAVDITAARNGACPIAPERHPGVYLGVIHFGTLPFESESVDGGGFWRVAHNMTAPGELDRGLREIHRVLRPRAPLVAAVRAATPQIDHLPYPVLVTGSNGNGGERTDLNFPGESLVPTFGAVGFKVEHAERIQEGEIVDGEPVINDYWALHLLRQ